MGDDPLPFRVGLATPFRFNHISFRSSRPGRCAAIYDCLCDLCGSKFEISWGGGPLVHPTDIVPMGHSLCPNRNCPPRKHLS